MKDRPIILIDDDDDDLDLLRQAFDDLKVENELIIFNDGFKFLEFIRTTDKRSFFILCDINMTRISGLELRKKIFDDERLRLKCIPFLFFSTSRATPVVEEAYSYNVQGYFVKPPDFNKLKNMIHAMIEYWNFSEHPNSE